MKNPVLNLVAHTIGTALAVGAFLLLVYAPDAQAQAPSQGVTIDGTLRMTRTDGPQIQLNDTRFPERGPAVTLRGASATPTTGITVLEHAGTSGSTYLVLQPVGTVGSGTGFLAYGVGGLSNPCSTNLTVGYNNVNPPYYLIGTSTAGGPCSPYAPLWFWNMNRVAFRLDKDSAGSPEIHVNHPLVFDDGINIATDVPESRLGMSRLRKATATQEGLSWPIEFSAPIFDGEGQQLRKIRLRAFGANTGGTGAIYGLRITDDAGNVLAEVSTTGLWLRLGGVLKQVAEGPPDSGGPGRRVLTVAN